MNKFNEILSVLLLIGFVLFFAHSELSLFSETNDYDYCRDKHKGHDYCEIIKDARIERTPNLQKKISSPVIFFSHNLCSDECNGIEAVLNNEQFTSAKKFFSVNTFLFNKTLLI